MSYEREPRRRPYPDERAFFHVGLNSARSCGLAWEYIMFYKIGRRRGDSIKMAVWWAINEWDL